MANLDKPKRTARRPVHPAPAVAAPTPAPHVRPSVRPLAYSVKGDEPAHVSADTAPQRLTVESGAIIERAKRVHTCQAEVFAAIAPLLEQYHCKLGTVQEIVDGQAGPVQIVVMATD